MNRRGSATARQRHVFESIWSRTHRGAHVLTELRLHPFRHLIEGLTLDIGAGDGQIVNFKPAAATISLDLALAACRRVSSGRYPAVQGSAERLPFRARCFDTVVMLEVLEHVALPAATLAEIARVIKPGGALILSTPNESISLVERVYHVVRDGVWPTRANLPAWDPLHERRFAVHELTSHLREAGFEILKLRLWAKSGFAFGYYVVDGIGRRLGLGGTTPWFARADAVLGVDTPANIVVVARRRRACVA